MVKSKIFPVTNRNEEYVNARLSVISTYLGSMQMLFRLLTNSHLKD